MRQISEFKMRVAAGLVSATIFAACLYLLKEERTWASFSFILLIFLCAMSFWYWKKTVPFENRLADSRFAFLRLIVDAKHSVFAIGPNLNFVAVNSAIKQKLFERLAKRDFTAWLLVSDPQAAVAQVWEGIGYNPGFSSELNRALTTFSSWINPTERPGLQVKKSGLVTLSLVFVDAEQDNGKLLIIPIPRNVSGDARPCFLIRKRQHPAAFNAYYDSYRGLFNSPLAQGAVAGAVHAS